jgi:hypothetical protein
MSSEDIQVVDRVRVIYSWAQCLIAYVGPWAVDLLWAPSSPPRQKPEADLLDLFRCLECGRLTS